MNQNDILVQLVNEYESLIWTGYHFPNPYRGEGEIKAIVLGADPTHIVDDRPIEMKVVFGLDDPEKSPYWKGMKHNLHHIGLTLDNIYVQNVCRNYFDRETSQNIEWERIAREYWIPFLKQELDDLFDKRIPILMTTQFILWAAMEDIKKRLKAKTLYKECISIHEEDNLFKRKLYAFYRHHWYSLKRENRESYAKFLIKEISIGNR